MEMKAAVLEEHQKLVCKNVPVPELKAGEVRIAVKYCGVCGTDLHIVYDGSLRYPHIPGHELSGVVVEAADEAGADLVGKEVVAYGIVGCGSCEYCLRGDYSKCQNYTFIGAASDGAMAEYANYPAENVIPLDGLPLRDAALVEPVAVSVHAVRLLRKIPRRALVVGTGPVGLLAAQALRAMGSEEVFVAGFSNRKEKLVRDLGFQFVDCTNESVADVPASFGFEGVPAVLECSGRVQGLNFGLRATMPGADVVLVGIFSGAVTLDSDACQAILRRELVVHGSWISTHDPKRGVSDWEFAAHLIRDGKIDVGRMVTDEVSLEGLARKLDDMHNRRTADIKVLVRI